MKHNVYSIFDTASGLYSRPLFSQSDGEANRLFVDLCTDSEHPVAKHPEDYSIHRIGVYDDTKGFLTNEDNECLQTGLEAVAKSRNVDPLKVAELQTKMATNTYAKLEAGEAT